MSFGPVPRFSGFHPLMEYVDNIPRGAKKRDDESWTDFNARVEQANITHRILSFRVDKDWESFRTDRPEADIALLPPALGAKVGDVLSIDHYYSHEVSPTEGQPYGELTIRRIPRGHDPSQPYPEEIGVKMDEIRPLLERILATVKPSTDYRDRDPGSFDRWLGGLMHLLKMGGGAPAATENSTPSVNGDLTAKGQAVLDDSQRSNVEINLMRLLKAAENASFVERDEIAFYLAQLPLDFSKDLLDNRDGLLKVGVREAAPRLCAAVDEIWAENTRPFEGAVSLGTFLRGPQPDTPPLREVLIPLARLRNQESAGLAAEFADLVVRRFHR